MTIAAFDFGTTGCKGSLFSEQGNLLATAYRPYSTHFPSAGWAVQRPSDWKIALIELAPKLIKDAGATKSDIACMAFSGHMNGCIPVTSTGEPLRDEAMLWADTRADSTAARFAREIPWSSFYRRTGAGLDLYVYPAAKIRWMKDNDHELYSRAAAFLGTKDVITAWLTGRLATDPSDASNTGLLNIVTGDWDSELVAAFGVDRAKLPRIAPSTAVLGGLTATAARLLGLKQGTPVVVGGGDVVCASAGAGAVSPGIAYACLGSASWVSVAQSKPMLDESLRVMNLCHVVPGLYSSQLISYTAGIAYQWAQERLFPSSDGATRPSFSAMDGIAGRSPAGANGVMFLPYLRAGGAPHYDTSARAAFVGLTMEAEMADFLRAILEGVAFTLRQLVEGLESCGAARFSELRIIGGGAQSDLWNRIISATLGRPVVTLTAQQEANTAGAALVGGIAVGALESFQETERFCHVASRIEPDPVALDVYESLFSVFREALPNLRSTNRALQTARDGRCLRANGEPQGGTS